MHYTTFENPLNVSGKFICDLEERHNIVRDSKRRKKLYRLSDEDIYQIFRSLSYRKNNSDFFRINDKWLTELIVIFYDSLINLLPHTAFFEVVSHSEKHQSLLVLMGYQKVTLFDLTF